MPEILNGLYSPIKFRILFISKDFVPELGSTVDNAAQVRSIVRQTGRHGPVLTELFFDSTVVF